MVSGGECQRAAIARALMIRPSVLICDEITAALDVSVQAQILNLLHRLKRQQQLSYLFISHDIAVVSLLCEKLLVLYRGRVMEYGSTGQILENPLHPYSRMLVCAANRWEFVPSETAHVTGAEAEPWSGCPYRRRCRLEKTECGDLGALLLEREPGHFTACPYAAE